MPDPTLIGFMNCSQGVPQFQFTQSEEDEFCARLDDLEASMARITAILDRLEAKMKVS